MIDNQLSWDEMLAVPPGELANHSKIPIRIIENTDALFQYLARYTADLVASTRDRDTPLRVIWPCGPKRHFAYLADIVNQERISWRNTINIQVDEWLDWQGRLLPPDHPFNLRRFLHRELFDRIDADLRPSPDQFVYHDPLDLAYVDRKLDELGGADILFGGIGFTGHVAYNEPPTSRWYTITPEQFLTARTRIVPTNDETFVMHAHRSTGGNTQAIPPMAITLGMKDLMATKTVRLVSDGGAWKQTIVRILCMHRPTVNYPCTLMQGHPDIELIIDGKTAACPPQFFNKLT